MRVQVYPGPLELESPGDGRDGSRKWNKKTGGVAPPVGIGDWSYTGLLEFEIGACAKVVHIVTRCKIQRIVGVGC